MTGPRPTGAPPVDGYWRRIGIQPHSIVWADEPAVSAPQGDRLARTDIGRRCARAVRNLEDIAEPTVTGLPKGSTFCATEAALASRITQAEQLMLAFTSSPHPWAAVEAEQASKITLQRGGAPGWALLPDGLVVEGDDNLAEGMVEVEALLSAAWVPGASAPRYRRGTQHSYPDFGTTDTSLVLHALCAHAAKGFDDLAGLLETVGGIFEEPSGLATQMYNRSGPIRKPNVIRSASGGRVYSWGEMLSAAPRRRHVFGQPSAINIYQLPFVGSLKASLAAVPWLFSFGPDDTALKAQRLRHMRWFSDDISGFDQSVTHQHQLTLYAMYGRLVDPGFGAYKAKEKDLPLIAAALDPDDAAFRYRKRGVTPSGTLTTAIDGTCINAARIIVSAARAMGVTPRRARQALGSTWAFFCQGDDTLIGASVPFDRAVYEATSLALGYKTAVQDGAVFLMHHIDVQHGRAVALAARVFQQTVFNEYGGEDTVLELAGLVARCARAVSNPWFPGTFRLLMEGAELAAEFNLSDYSSAVLALARPAVQQRLRELSASKPRLRGTFRHLPPPAISDLLAALFPTARDTVDPTALSMPRDAARRDALALAEWMATPEADRIGDPRLSVDLDTLIATIDTDRHAVDDTLSSHYAAE